MLCRTDPISSPARINAAACTEEPLAQNDPVPVLHAFARVQPDSTANQQCQIPKEPCQTLTSAASPTMDDRAYVWLENVFGISASTFFCPKKLSKGPT